MQVRSFGDWSIIKRKYAVTLDRSERCAQWRPARPISGRVAAAPRRHHRVTRPRAQASVTPHGSVPLTNYERSQDIRLRGSRRESEQKPQEGVYSLVFTSWWTNLANKGTSNAYRVIRQWYISYLGRADLLYGIRLCSFGYIYGKLHSVKNKQYIILRKS